MLHYISPLSFVTPHTVPLSSVTVAIKMLIIIILLQCLVLMSMAVSADFVKYVFKHGTSILKLV